MVNAVKGEVAFEVEGRSYKLVLDFNALCEVEDVLGAEGMDTTVQGRASSEA